MMLRSALVLLLLVDGTAVQWEQIGEDIYGLTTTFNSGLFVYEYLKNPSAVSISGDGKRIAIGGHDGEINANIGAIGTTGYVRIFEYTELPNQEPAWVQLGERIEGEDKGDYEGWSVSLSETGARVVIGAPFHDRWSSTAGYGRVRVFEWDVATTTWTQLGQDIDGEHTGAWAGYVVSINSDGSRVAFGAPLSGMATGNGDGKTYGVGCGSCNRAGSARAYQYDAGDNAWLKLGADDADPNAGDLDGAEPGEEFGFSLAMSGNGKRLVVGAARGSSVVNGQNNNAGRVRIYEFSDDGAASPGWVQVGQDIVGEPEPSGCQSVECQDWSGWSVSITDDGSRVAISSYRADVPGADNVGRVRVYDWPEGGVAWVKVGMDIVGEAANDESGWAVSLSGNGQRVASGARKAAGKGSVIVHQYELDGTGVGSWVKVGANIDGKQDGEMWGYCISIDDAGTRLAAYAISNDGPDPSAPITNVGAVRAYQIDAPQATSSATLNAQGGAGGDPHMLFPHGGKADYKGKNATYYNFVSAKNFSLNIMTRLADFELHDEANPRHKHVHGSFLTEAHVVARTNASKTVRVSLDADVIGKDAQLKAGDDYYASSQARNQIFVSGSIDGVPFKMGARREKVIDNLKLNTTWSSLRVLSPEFDVTITPLDLLASTRGGLWSKEAWATSLERNVKGAHHRLDLQIKLRVPEEQLALPPHGIIGQHWDGDGQAIDGEQDVYPYKGEFTTSAMAKGAIEGVPADYELADKYATAFKFSRFDATHAEPRDVAKLVAAGLLNMPKEGAEQDEEEEDVGATERTTQLLMEQREL